MNRLFTLFTALIFATGTTFGQELVEVTEQTIKIGAFKEEELYFGFATGDKIVFNFQEADNKDLKEIEIIEYPSNSKFSDYKSHRVENKSITVTKQSVYIFRFKNSALTGRICKIRIQRLPASDETKNLNSAVSWETKQETTYTTYTKQVIVGYDTSYIQKSKKELVSVDTTFTPLFDKNLRVHSEMAIGKTQYTYGSIDLPQNSYYPTQFNPYKVTELISWSYWIGVGQKAKEDYEQANKNISTGITAIGALTGYGALASLAASGISIFSNTNLGDNVRYKFYGSMNGQSVTIDYGNVITASGRNDRVTQGAFNLELYNDNFKDGIDVEVKVVAMQVTRVWEDISYSEMSVTPRYETKQFTDPVINTLKVPVTGQ
ncbi:MAG: hypothetical protein V4615_15370 [Bacteroidota bacterium]